MEQPTADTVKGQEKSGGLPADRPPAKRKAAGTHPPAVLWPVLVCLAIPFGLVLAAGQVEGFGRDEAAPLLLAMAVVGGLLLPLGAAAGALAARLEAVTAPELPRRGDWVRVGVARLGWLMSATPLPWVPLHLLGSLESQRSENHLVAAVVGLVALAPLVGFAWWDRRLSRGLAARGASADTPVSRLDAIPAAVWIGVLCVPLLGVPGVVAGGLSVSEGFGAVAVLFPWALATALAAAVLAGVRATLPGIPGPRGPAAARVAAAVVGAGWVSPYLIAVVGGEWLFGSQSVHTGRLVVACLSAAVLLGPVALWSWSREATRTSAG